MDVETKQFTCGRHRNKTYAYVYHNDKEFCELVLKEKKNRFIPEDFKQYLLQKMGKKITPIQERGSPYFLKACSFEVMKVFKNILGPVEIEMRQVHPPAANLHPNGFLGVFYRFFMKKCVFNANNVDGYNKSVEKYASIFPFLVSEKVKLRDVEVTKHFDKKFSEEMQNFLCEHFENINVEDISKLFLSNIVEFKSKYYINSDLSKIINNMSLDENCFGENLFHDYIKKFPRFNSKGASRGYVLNAFIIGVSSLYNKDTRISHRKYNSSYFLKLPENNFSELFNLLNVEFFQKERSEYVYMFQKYLFFFIYALKREKNPIFFIDDGLFECMKSFQIFKKSRADVFDLKYHLSMMTLIYRRKQPCHRKEGCDLDDENLRHVKEYIEKFPNISEALFEYEVNTDVIETIAYMTTKDTCLDVCFSKNFRNNIYDFYELILHGAFSPKDITRLVRYNAYTGQECFIKMPQNKDEIRKWVQTYNKYDFSYQLPPEQFLTWGQEEYFRAETIDWKNKGNV